MRKPAAESIGSSCSACCSGVGGGGSIEFLTEAQPGSAAIRKTRAREGIVNRAARCTGRGDRTEVVGLWGIRSFGLRREKKMGGRCGPAAQGDESIRGRS